MYSFIRQADACGMNEYTSNNYPKDCWRHASVQKIQDVTHTVNAVPTSLGRISGGKQRQRKTVPKYC